MAHTVTTDQIDYAAAQVMTIIHENHDIATHIWPMETPRQYISTITQLKPPISKAGRRQIGRLVKLRNECNKTTKLYLETSTDHARTPMHIIEKITTLLNPAKPISTFEAHKQCNKAKGTIVRQASNTLTEKLRDKENISYGKIPKQYHNILKIGAGLLPRSRDQPRVHAQAPANQHNAEYTATSHRHCNPHITRKNNKEKHRPSLASPMDTTTKSRQLRSHITNPRHNITTSNDPRHIHHTEPL